jgi:multiple sugar transport system substrate-binding protein
METRGEIAMSWANRIGWGLVLVGLVTLSPHVVRASEFDWKKFQGQTISFLANANPIGAAILKHKSEFEAKTGIKVVSDRYPEQQMRQRLLTALNARSDEFDVFMTLPSLEAPKFAKSGWYADLSDRVKSAPRDYDLGGLNKSLLEAGTIDGHLTSIPINVDGPVLFYRKDLLKKCGVKLPSRLEEFNNVLARLKACEPTVTPFVTRGLKQAVAFAYSAFLHNMGGRYMQDGKSAFCSSEGKAALGLYGKLLREYGPRGVVNASFYQISDLYRAGRAAIAFESINQLDTITENPARIGDTGVALLPPGKGQFGANRNRMGPGHIRLQQEAGCCVVFRSMGHQPRGPGGDRAGWCCGSARVG